MDVVGEGRNVRRAHVLQVATQGGLEPGWAAQAIDRMLPVALDFAQRAPAFAIRSATVKRIATAISASSTRLA